MFRNSSTTLDIPLRVARRLIDKAFEQPTVIFTDNKHLTLKK